MTTAIAYALREAIEKLAKGAGEPKTTYWVHGSFEELDLCYECAMKECARLAEMVSADSSDIMLMTGHNDHDSLPYCHECGEKLDGGLTDYAAMEEFDYLKVIPVPEWTPEEWYNLGLVTEALVSDHPIWWEIEQLLDEAGAELPLGRSRFKRAEAV